MDAGEYVKALALCSQHMTLNNDQLADHYWPGWREAWGG
jgi:hypothetical protein